MLFGTTYELQKAFSLATVTVIGFDGETFSLTQPGAAVTHPVRTAANPAARTPKNQIFALVVHCLRESAFRFGPRPDATTL
ncbi:hypothetical protein Acsp02_63110 [Actinoplanes sp. NBRC 103695]|nr:hypothetical protein Acsp02_63110 [Actinoplanes sp. NBRC 103695]